MAAAKKTPEAVQPYIIKVAPALALIMTLVDMSLPYLSGALTKVQQFYEFLKPYHPEDMACVLVGLFMAFFGGEFPALITAIEAYRQLGFEPTLKALRALWEDAKTVQAANFKDDKEDKDGDGVADVKQINASELVERKVLLFLRTTDPQKVSTAIAAISSGWLAVLASLKVSFARAVALGGAIGDILRKPALRYLSPPLKKIVPEDYHRWIMPCISYTCKTIAISIAWSLQKVISAFHSSIRGGHIAAAGVVVYLHKYKFISVSADDTLVDEVVGYIIAAFGFLIQATTGFHLAFPLNLLLLPISIVEWLLVWMIMK